MFAGFEPVTAELTLFTDALVIQGTVTTPYRRVTDILNQADGPFLVLDRVSILEHGLRGSPVTLPYAQVNLDTILFATADVPVEPNPTMRVVKTAEPAVVSVPPFQVAGTVHLLVGDGEIRDALRSLTDAFVPVTDATYWADSLGEPRRRALLVAVNHRRAQYIAPHREVDPWAGMGQLREAAAEDERSQAPAGLEPDSQRPEPAQEA